MRQSRTGRSSVTWRGWCVQLDSESLDAPGPWRRLVEGKGRVMAAESMAKIDESRERLRQLVTSTNDEEFARPIDGKWTGAAMLAHIAFWDRRTAWLLRRCRQGKCGPSPVDLDAVNESALPQWRLIPPRAAAEEALAAAEEIDELVASMPAELLISLREGESEIRYDRSDHRNDHLDQIERALGRT
jgi:DinB superfamily